MGEFSNFKDVIDILKIHEKTFDINKGSISNSRTVQSLVYFSKKKKLIIPNGIKVPVTLTGKWIEFNLDEIFNHREQS